MLYEVITIVGGVPGEAFRVAVPAELSDRGLAGLRDGEGPQVFLRGPERYGQVVPASVAVGREYQIGRRNLDGRVDRVDLEVRGLGTRGLLVHQGYLQRRPVGAVGYPGTGGGSRRGVSRAVPGNGGGNLARASYNFV